MRAYHRVAEAVRTVGRLRVYAVATVLLLGFVASMPLPVSAAQLSQRSLEIGSVTPSAQTTHIFRFTNTTSAMVGSVKFEYCTSPLAELPCDTPTGLDATSAVLTAQSGAGDFSLASASGNVIILTRPAATTLPNSAFTYTFDDIINPSVVDTFYVRITTYSSEDATGPEVDFGAVVNATSEGVAISSEVPPILKFCVGLNLGIDCTTADDNLVDLGDLSNARASSGTSQMLAATNAEFGLAIAAIGTTMTSGNNVIPALTAPTVSAPGNAQFGINLRDNSDPDVGEEPTGIGIANPTPDYNIPNRYLFASGDTVATSPDATDVRKFTVSYVVNIPPSQTPGVYTATLTYICTATF